MNNNDTYISSQAVHHRKIYPKCESLSAHKSGLQSCRMDDQPNFSMIMNAGAQQTENTSAVRGYTLSEEFQGEDDDSKCEFQIPLRYTRSGRKRAVSFPLKVSCNLSCPAYKMSHSTTHSIASHEISPCDS